FRFAACCEHDDRHRGVGAKRTCEIETGLTGHHHVEDQEIEMQADELCPSIGRTLRRGDTIALSYEKTRQQAADAAVVVDQQEVERIVGRLETRAIRCRRIDHFASLAARRLLFKITSSTLSGSSGSIMASRN